MTTAPEDTPSRRAPFADLLALAVVLLAVAVIYGSLINAPALIWDDEPHIFDNSIFRAGPWWKLWTTTYFGLYIPVTYSVWDVLFHVWSAAVWPFRVLNVALHLTNVLLFRRLLSGAFNRLDLDDSVALTLGVAIFALHPLQAATVSWISAGRDLLATAFALAAVLVFFGGGRYRIVISTALYAAAVFSKPQVASVPLAVLLLIWLFQRDRLRPALIAMSVWLAVAATSVLITASAQAGGAPAVSMLQRPIVALDALGFYLLKFVAPLRLASDYGRTPTLILTNYALLVPTIATAIAAVLVSAVATRRNRALSGMLVWPVLMLPVLGLIPFSYQSISTVADHYNYLPLAALAAVSAIVVSRLRSRLSLSTPSASRAFIALLFVLSAGASWLTWRRTRDWIGNERFFADMLARNSASMSARINLSATRCENGDWFNGLPVIQGAFAVDSTSGRVLANVALCSFAAGHFDDVVRLQRRFAETVVRENLAKDHKAAGILANVIAGAYVQKDEPFKAFVYLCQASALTPRDPDVQRNIDRVRGTLEARHERVRCPGLLSWDVVMRGINVQ